MMQDKWKLNSDKLMANIIYISFYCGHRVYDDTHLIVKTCENQKCERLYFTYACALTKCNLYINFHAKCQKVHHFNQFQSIDLWNKIIYMRCSLGYRHKLNSNLWWIQMKPVFVHFICSSDGNSISYDIQYTYLEYV